MLARVASVSARRPALARALAASKHTIVQHRVEGREYVYSSGGDDSFVVRSSADGRSPVEALSALPASFLPKGYPESVGRDYLPYTGWTCLQMGIGSAAGVLSTQALLCAVGIGQATAMPLAATLNWVLKDGLGQLGSVVTAAVVSDRFDSDPKRWRLFATCCETAARTLESASPLAPGYFLLVASVANLGKSIACIAASATRATFHKALARRSNLADLTGKAGSQAIATSLAGTSAGLALSATTATTPHDLLVTVACLSGVQLWATRRSLTCLELPCVTRRVGCELVTAQLAGLSLPTPAEYAATERLLDSLPLAPRSPRPPPAAAAAAPADAPPIVIGGALDGIARSPAQLRSLRSSLAGCRHMLGVVGEPSELGGSPQAGVQAGGREIRVLLEESATEDDVWLAYVHACLLRRRLPAATEPARGELLPTLRSTLDEAKRLAPELRDAACAAGWDMLNLQQLENVHSRYSWAEPAETADHGSC